MGLSANVGGVRRHATFGIANGAVEHACLSKVAIATLRGAGSLPRDLIKSRRSTIWPFRAIEVASRAAVGGRTLDSEAQASMLSAQAPATSLRLCGFQLVRGTPSVRIWMKSGHNSCQNCRFAA